jgi:UDP-N-acetylmuramate dehydrogenase
MLIDEHVSLASLTTFKVGGTARYVLTCASIEDIQQALVFSRERLLPWYVLGSGSNVLAGDKGYDGVLVRFASTQDCVFGLENSDGICEVVAGAGVPWDTLVTETVSKGLWGLENLAGIPGTVGAAPVQNIGAYGADVSDSLIYLDAFDSEANALVRLTKKECGFGYRDSIFKQNPSYIIWRAAFALHTIPTPHVQYADLQALHQQGRVLDTPLEIAKAVREVRARKFPDLRSIGTAGSFFKNPTVSIEKFTTLKKQYPELPGFVVSDTTMKIPLGWILDHILGLRGFTKGNVRLFENQALVVVAENGATYAEIDALAKEVELKVSNATGIVVEREVRFLQNRNS